MPPLRDVTLPEALAVVRREHGTGVLHVAAGAEERRFLFVDGELRAAQSTREDEMLGSWLVHRHVIREGEKALALLELVAGEAPSLGHVLRRLGFLDQAGLDRELQALATHILTRAVAEAADEVAFEEDVDSTPWDIFAEAATPQLILEAARVCADFEGQRRALEPLDQYVHAEQRLEDLREEYDLSPAEAFLLSRLDGTRRVADLAGGCGLPQTEVIATLYALKVAGLVTTRAESSARGLRGTGRPLVDVGSLAEPELEERERLAVLARSTAGVDHYGALGLDPSAGSHEVERAWADLQRRFHPQRAYERHLADRKEELETVHARAEAAHEVLSSPATRARYDRIRAEALAAVSRVEPLPGEGDVQRQQQARSEVVAANLQRAEELERQGEVHLAIQLLETAAELEPGPQTLVRLARAYRSRPVWYGRALESLRRAVELDPGWVAAWLELAELWRQRGNQERQRKALEKALAADPENEAARESYRRLAGESQLGKVLRRYRA